VSNECWWCKVRTASRSWTRRGEPSWDRLVDLLEDLSKTVWGLGWFNPYRFSVELNSTALCVVPVPASSSHRHGILQCFMLVFPWSFSYVVAAFWLWILNIRDFPKKLIWAGLLEVNNLDWEGFRRVANEGMLWIRQWTFGYREGRRKFLASWATTGMRLRGLLPAAHD